MSLGFKRVISSIMAFVMMVSTLVMVNVASVSAATYTYEYVNGSVNTDSYFTESGDSQSNADVLYDASYTNAASEVVTISQGLKLNSSGKVEFTVQGNANITVIYSTREDKSGTTGLSLDGGASQVDSATNTDGAKTYTGTLSAGTYTVMRANDTSEGVLYYVKVEDTVEGTLTSYSITGTSNLSEGDTFNVGDYTANVGADGNWTVTVSSANIPFAIGSELSVSKAGYTVSPETITLSEGADATSFAGGNLNFTQMSFTALAEGTYDAATIQEGLPNFEIVNEAYPTELNRLSTSGNDSISFIVNDNATVTVTYASASSSKTCAAAIYSGETQVIAGIPTDGTDQAVTATDLSAGTYTIKVIEGVGGSTSARIRSIAVTYGATDTSITTTTETTTVTTTEETTTETTTVTTTEETTTETTTEAPVTPGEGYVAMGSYDFNSSKISDTTGTYANMEFNLRQINEANVQLRGEAEGNFIRFKVASASNLTATFEDNALIMIGSDGSNVNLVSGVAVNLQADVIYTLRGEDGNNTYLSNLTFATGGTSEETTEGTTAEVTETTTEAVTGDEIRVPISITGNSGDIKININGTDRTFGADGTIELYLTEGSEIKFDFATDVANKIVGWEGLDVDSYVNNTHEYFSATATTSGVHFTYNADAQTAIDEDFAVAGSDVVLDYGNYGYGDNKGTAPGATQAESVAALNSVSGVVTLREFLGGGYKTNDQRLILNNNDQTGASFTVEGAGYLIIDCGRGTPKVTVNGETATATAIGNSGKQGYALEAGDKVVITKGTTNGDSMQLKSIRFQTDGNVFNNVSGTAGTAVVDYDTLDEEAKAELGTVPEGKVFARIVGSLNTNLVDADTVGTVGMLVIKKSSVDSAISASDNFAPAQSLEVEGAINLEESEALYDGIYDGNAAVDGEYTLDPNTAYSDGIYYMLRYVALDPEAYYVFPYTIESGSDTPVFDFANAVADTDLSSYMLDASVQ